MALNGKLSKKKTLTGTLTRSSGSGSVQEIYWVQYGIGTATNAEVNIAVSENKLPVCYWDVQDADGNQLRRLYYLIRHTPTEAFFANINNVSGAITVYRLYNNSWKASTITFQEELTWDYTPREASSNPVTSGGIYRALQNVSVAVDSELSTTSEAPVQNKVITEALATKADQANVESTIPPIVNTWLCNNVAQETGYVLDSTLSISNAAAPADKVGTFFRNGGINSVNPANIVPDPTMNGSGWEYSGISLSIVPVDGSLSKGCQVERTGSSSGRLGFYLPVSALTDGTKYLISIRELNNRNANLSIRSNNGTFSGFLNWKVTEQTMTKNGNINTYEWVYNSSDFSSSEIGISVYLKISADPGIVETYYEPFMGDADGNTSYAVFSECEWALKSEQIKPTNLFDGEYILNSYYAGNGSVASANNYQRTPPKLFGAGSYIFITNKQYFGANASKAFAFSDPSATAASSVITCDFLADVTRTTGNDTITYGLYTFTIADPQYIAFNVGVSQFDDAEYFMIVQGSTLNDFPQSYLVYFVPYSGVTEGVGLNQTMLDQIITIRKKKIVFDGDSICAGYGAAGGYGKIIASHNDMVYINYGVSGATLAYGTKNGAADRHWVSGSVDNYDTDADYYILEGGVNDVANSVPLGTISASYNASDFVRTTFIGALEYICCKVMTLYPGKKCGFVLPHGIFNDSNYFPDWHTTYKPAMLSVFAKWGMPYIDLESLVPPLNQVDSLKAVYTKDGDGWHPNELGYKLFYVDKITEWLETL